MSVPVRGWRFEAAPVPSSGPTPRRLVVAATGRVAMVEDDAAIRQALVVLLSTSPGERVMRPDYGCPLHRLVFSPNDATTAGLAVHYVRQSIERWEPRIDIVRLDAGAAGPRRGGTAGTLLLIELDYRVRATGRPGALELALDLDGGPAP